MFCLCTPKVGCGVLMSLELSGNFIRLWICMFYGKAVGMFIFVDSVYIHICVL